MLAMGGLLLPTPRGMLISVDPAQRRGWQATTEREKKRRTPFPFLFERT
jgi:hypothetical protein